MFNPKGQYTLADSTHNTTTWKSPKTCNELQESTKGPESWVTRNDLGSQAGSREAFGSWASEAPKAGVLASIDLPCTGTYDERRMQKTSC